MNQKLILIAFVFLSISLYGQEKNPLLKIKGDDQEFVKLDSLHIDIQIVGNIATTTMEMAFYNNAERVLEGELNFPMKEGETVSRFAMDVNGKLREGVVVEKEIGTQAFESIVSEQIDPGLLEMTEGNNFKARVYPIPAKDNRTKIGGLLSEDLTEGYGPEEFTLRKAIPGKYKIEADYYSNSQQKVRGGVNLRAILFTNYGRKNEQRKEITIRLTSEEEVIHIGDLIFERTKKWNEK